MADRVRHSYPRLRRDQRTSDLDGDAHHSLAAIIHTPKIDGSKVQVGITKDRLARSHPLATLSSYSSLPPAIKVSRLGDKIKMYLQNIQMIPYASPAPTLLSERTPSKTIVQINRRHRQKRARREQKNAIASATAPPAAGAIHGANKDNDDDCASLDTVEDEDVIQWEKDNFAEGKDLPVFLQRIKRICQL